MDDGDAAWAVRDVGQQRLGALHREVSLRETLIVTFGPGHSWPNKLLTVVASDRPWGDGSAALRRGRQAVWSKYQSTLCMPNRRDGIQDRSSRLLCKALFCGFPCLRPFR